MEVVLSIPDDYDNQIMMLNGWYAAQLHNAGLYPPAPCVVPPQGRNGKSATTISLTEAISMSATLCVSFYPLSVKSF